VEAPEIADEPADYLPYSFGHGKEAVELRLGDVAEVERDIEMTLHFDG
jgi:hypothetical protein